MATAKRHYFVVNQLGQSANRQGAFESREAAIEWAEKNYRQFPCWLVPAEYIGVIAPTPLNAEGKKVSAE
jgi:hypothetical protein